MPSVDERSEGKEGIRLIMKKIKKVIIIFALILITFILLAVICSLYEKNKPTYNSEYFGIAELKSQTDFDGDGIDDYTDILEGAKNQIKVDPKYKSAYYQGGYPPEKEGVCTDVIWRALKNAGYNLKDMVDEDIKNNIEHYPRVNRKARSEHRL